MRLLRLLLRLGVDLRKLPCRRSWAAAARDAREGGTPFLIEEDDPERGMLKPSRFSTGGSNFAALDRRSSRFSKMKEEGRLGVCSLPSDSSSLESLSNKAGYRSLMDLVGLSSTRLVSVRARPFSSTVRMTDVLKRGLLSDIDPREGLPNRFTGDAVRGTWLLIDSITLAEKLALFGRVAPVVFARCKFELGRLAVVSVDEIVSDRVCVAAPFSFDWLSFTATCDLVFLVRLGGGRTGEL
jgi:hypothetical protein